MDCSYLKIKLDRKVQAIEHIPNIHKFCSKIIPFVNSYEKKATFYNKTVRTFLIKYL